MKWLRDLLRKGVVLELWWVEEDREYACLATRGTDTVGAVRHHKDPRRAAETAAEDILLSQGEAVSPAASPVSSPSPGSIDLTAVRRRLAAGEKLARIAADLGCTRATLYHRLRKEDPASGS